MNSTVGLGRVAIVGGGEAIPRVLRSLRELTRTGQARAVVALHEAGTPSRRAFREADEVLELDGAIGEALRAARADSACLGRASLQERADFAAACEREGIIHIGPAADTLRRVSTSEGVAELAAQLGVRSTTIADAPAHARLIEAIVVRDRAGTARIVGLADA
jgi:acetyl/propionyl-CoA carboxylase alpha subunit